MPIYVKSEIEKLNKVVLHRPGKELGHLVPDELERLLSDDIPYLRTAQSEYDLLAGILKESEAEVVYLEDRMAKVLKADPAIKESFVKQSISESRNTAQKFKNQLYEFLMGIPDEKRLALKTTSGAGIRELGPTFGSPLVSLVKSDNYFITDPIPNLYFTRDPLACIGSGVSLNCIYSRTRRREIIFGKYILEHRPGHTGHTSFYYKKEHLFSIEGGDILSLSRGVLAVGIPQRATPGAVESLTQNIFEDKGCEVETILALNISSTRAYMYLDIVCTQVDHDRFTIRPGILGSLRVYGVCRGDKSELLHVIELDQPLPVVLTIHLGPDKMTMIRYDGKDKIAPGREQWNDRSSILCIRPERAMVHDRDYIINPTLRDNGIEVLEMPSSELSRDRGGPWCMNIPLEREEI